MTLHKKVNFDRKTELDFEVEWLWRTCFLGRSRILPRQISILKRNYSLCTLLLKLTPHNLQPPNFIIMSDAVVAATPAKVAKVAKSTPKKKAAPKKAADHPKYTEMVAAAIAALKEKKGSSKAAILKYIIANYKVGDKVEKVNKSIKTALKGGLVAGSLKQTKGTGASGSFKLGEKKVEKKAKKPAAKKVVKAKKPKSPKKAAAKKPAAKKSVKAKSPKKAAKPAAKKAAKSPAKKAAKKVVKKPAAKKPAAKKAAKAKK